LSFIFLMMNRYVLPISFRSTSDAFEISSRVRGILYERQAAYMQEAITDSIERPRTRPRCRTKL